MSQIINHGIFNLIIEGNIACMDFNPEGTRYPEELVHSTFLRECRNLMLLQRFSWCPEGVTVEVAKRKIRFKWYDNTCENYLPDDYIKQLKTIVKDLHSEQLYKPNFYTKCFYTDDRDRIHAYIFYSTSSYKEQPIAMDFYRPILNPERSKLVDELEVDGKLDMGVLLKHAFNSYIKWPGDPLPEIYQQVYLTDNYQ